MAYKVSYTKNFNKDVERCRKRGYNMSHLKTILNILIETGTVPFSCRPHKLSGNHEGEWEPMEQREQIKLYLNFAES